MKERTFTIKNLFLILSLSLLSALSLNAADEYEFKPENFFLGPYYTANIDLRKWQYYRSKDDVKDSLEWGGVEFPTNPPSSPSADANKAYYDPNIVMIGGYSGRKTDTNIALLREILTGATLNISVSTDSGEMELVSQSNSAYRWPFEFWLIVKSSKNQTAGQYNGNKTISRFKVTDTNVNFQSDLISFEDGDANPPEDGSIVFFDLILAFPIASLDRETQTLKSESGKTYYFEEKDDYAAMVTVNLSLEKDGEKLGSGLTLTVPFSAYYSKSQSATVESVASLSVALNSVASTLNLQTESKTYLKMGEVDLIANYVSANLDTPIDPPKHVHLFLSSNPNPWMQGDQFRFVKVGETIPTVANSVPFRIYLVGEEGFYDTNYQQRIEFDGTLSIPTTPPPDYSIDANQQCTADHSKFATAKYFHVNIYSAEGSTVKYFQYSGSLYIETDKVELGQLVSGIYQEDVYVHVFSD